MIRFIRRKLLLKKNDFKVAAADFKMQMEMNVFLLMEI